MTEHIRILIIDDEEAMRDSCTQVLEREGYIVESALSGQEGWEIYQKNDYHVILLDLKLPGLDGVQVLSRIVDTGKNTPVIIITGFASIESAVNTIKIGAFDYLAKPFSPLELRVVVQKALDSIKKHRLSAERREKVREFAPLAMVTGNSPAMENVLDIVKRVSPTDSTVLITGESGTGKELLATEIHRHSSRSDSPFVVVDCGALVETLFESELFGHVKGSFTGAHVTKHGRFEVANGGTIFLDEISNISLNIQAKLLRAIQEREVTRIGSSEPIKVDVRILAATNESLSDCVRHGKFREDLFYRLSVVPIHLPALRERKEDIPILIDHFLKKFSRKTGQETKTISSNVKKALQEYAWPGNIRELENTIERAVVLSRKTEIELEDLIYHGIGSGLHLARPEDGRYKPLDDLEKEYIKVVLQSQYGNRSKTAKILGIDRKTLLAKIKKYHLE